MSRITDPLTPIRRAQPRDVACGSGASIPRCPRYVRLCSKSGAERWGNRPAALRVFDLDDLGTEPGECLRARWAGLELVGPRASRTQL
jgi:hypothetical protein